MNRKYFLFFLYLITIVTVAIPLGEKNMIDIIDMTLMQECSDDLNYDTEKEIIQLYASIEKDKNGNLLFDDSEEWQIVIKGRKGNTCVYQRRIQMGNVYFCICRVFFYKKIIVIEDTIDNLVIREIHYSFFLRKYITKTVSEDKKSYPHYIFK